MIRDLDSTAPQESAMPIEMVPDEHLFRDGRIKDLFDRVYTRKKAGWDPTTRTRPLLKKRIAEITDKDSIEEKWAIIEEDSVAHYKFGNIECWIVRYSTGKYACEVFRNNESIDSFVKNDFPTLADYLIDTYGKDEKAVMVDPPVVKRRPGRPKTETAITA